MEITALVVDDNTWLVEMLQNFLEKKNFRVRAAKDADEAIKDLDCNPAPDIVILDYMMPVASGATVYDHLRNSPSTKDVPIIVLTAISSSIVERNIPASPQTQFISKPVDLDVLNAAMRLLLGPKYPSDSVSS